MIDNNTMYVRYDALGSGTGGTISYYGYINQNQVSNPNPSDSTAAFSIKKVSWNGNVQSTVWSNNAIATFECDWTNRAAYFATPSGTSSITATYSFDGYKNNIRFNWTSVTGVSRYLVTLSGGPYNRAITYLADALSSAVLNPEHNTSTLTFINQTGCLVQNVATGSTYYITVQPSNSYGTCTASSGSITI